MAKASDEHPPTAHEFDPLEMPREEATRMIGLMLDLRRRFLRHQLRLTDGADPLEVDFACVAELRLFASRDRVLRQLRLPSGKFMRALEDKVGGGDPDYFDRHQMNRPPLDSRKRLMGVVTHLRETLIVGEAFKRKAGKASKELMKRLNTAGLRMPDGKAFRDATITDWHEHVAHHGQRGELEWDTFEALQQALNRQYPEHVGWNRSRLLQWLDDESIPELTRPGYFDSAEKV